MIVTKILMSCLFCLMAISGFGQNVCYHSVGGQDTCYQIFTTKFLMRSEILDSTIIKNVLQDTGIGSVKRVINMGDGLFFIGWKNFKT